MSLLLALALAQGVQLAQLSGQTNNGSSGYDPEIEALMRHRDEQRRARQQDQAEADQAPAAQVPPNQAPAVQEAAPETGGDDGASLAAVVPPAVAQRLAACIGSANAEPERGLADARAWRGEKGGAYADLCEGYAFGRAGRWREAATAYETGGATPGLDAVTRARLWSQAGNAALIGGDKARALQAFDEALAQPLPSTLATGEIYLDRARARVAADDQPGARVDLDKALVLAGSDPMAWLLSATLARRMNDLPLARTHIQKAAQLAGNDAAVALEEGVIDALSGDRDAAARAAFGKAKELARPGSDIAAQAEDYLAQLGSAPAAADGTTPPPKTDGR